MLTIFSNRFKVLALFALGSVNTAAFDNVRIQRRQRSAVIVSQTSEKAGSFSLLDDNDDNDDVEYKRTNEPYPFSTRRQMFSDFLIRSTTAATVCGCLSCSAPHAAYGLAQIKTPPSEAIRLYDLPRNQLQDAMFAQGMAVGMVDYEKEAYPTKKRLFKQLFASLETVSEPTIVEVGMGSFPNALYYKSRDGLDIIGVDPNDRMEGYARDNAARAKLVSKDNLRIVHGVSEALPFADASVDAVVCTLTLCSVVDPAKSVAEIRRVLKPGGKFLFWEHVLSETDFALAQQQILLTPNQVKRADGCHLDRRTGDVIRAAGFQALDLEYMELKNFSFLNPTVCGIATA